MDAIRKNKNKNWTYVSPAGNLMGLEKQENILAGEVFTVNEKGESL